MLHDAAFHRSAPRAGFHALLLDHLGLRDKAARVQRAVEQDIASREGSRSTRDTGDAVIALLQA